MREGVWVVNGRGEEKGEGGRGGPQGSGKVGRGRPRAASQTSESSPREPRGVVDPSFWVEVSWGGISADVGQKK